MPALTSRHFPTSFSTINICRKLTTMLSKDFGPSGITQNTLPSACLCLCLPDNKAGDKKECMNQIMHWSEDRVGLPFRSLKINTIQRFPFSIAVNCVFEMCWNITRRVREEKKQVVFKVWMEQFMITQIKNGLCLNDCLAWQLFWKHSPVTVRMQTSYLRIPKDWVYGKKFSDSTITSKRKEGKTSFIWNLSEWTRRINTVRILAATWELVEWERYEQCVRQSDNYFLDVNSLSSGF